MDEHSNPGREWYSVRWASGLKLMALVLLLTVAYAALDYIAFWIGTVK
jgi:hypothetical protein